MVVVALLKTAGFLSLIVHNPRAACTKAVLLLIDKQIQFFTQAAFIPPFSLSGHVCLSLIHLHLLSIHGSNWK